MITPQADIQIDGTLSGKKIDMSFDEHSLIHLMNILTDLYSDSEQAIIREYAINAYDAHIEAGIIRPIEVEIPNHLHPFLTIRDFGVGLDAEGIENIYSKYGASTKRETNDQVGMLGLGCKSALTYTSQFTLVSIKDKVRTQVVISRNEEGAGSMTVVSETETDEPNGTEVTIPIRRHNSIAVKAQEFFKYWPDNTVLVNGERPERIGGLSIGHNKLLVKGSYKSQIVMGNVPYPFVDGLNLGGSSVIVFAPIGSVVPAPSRESLRTTESTRNYIAQIQNEFRKDVETAAQEDIDSKTNHFQAMRANVNWNALLPRDLRKVRSYKNQEIPELFTGYFTIASVNSHKVSENSRSKSLQAEYFIDSLQVHDYRLNFTASHKKKLLKYCEDNGIKVNHFILCDQQITGKWIDDVPVVDWETIKAIRLPQHKSFSSKKVKGSYPGRVGLHHQDEIEASSIDVSKPLYWANLGCTDNWSDILAAEPTATLIELSSNRVIKFCRDFPMARRKSERLAEIASEYAKAVSRDDIILSAINSEYRIAGALYKLDPKKIDDANLRRLITIKAKGFSEAWNKYLKYRGLSSNKNLPKTNIEVNIFVKYPLLSRLTHDTIHEHDYLYLNAVHSASKENA
jgi:hypothetical protein